MLACRLVRELREARDQIFEEIAHLEVGDGIGMRVDLGEPVEDLVEQSGVVEPLEVIREQEFVEEYVADIAGAIRDIVDQVAIV